jgi:thiamine-monophosphate kinase
MGADPAWALLAITLPSPDIGWIEGFCSGFQRLAARFGVRCIGGDTTRGPLTISVTVAGTLPRGYALTRHGANSGDAIYVTGNIGDAGLGLQATLGRWTGPNTDGFVQHLNYPTPRVETGLVLRHYASAAIDVSDGLLADLGHVLRASGVGARLELASIPVSNDVMNIGGFDFALNAGDDYELCFTVPATRQAAMENALAQAGLTAYRIGEITTQPGIQCLTANGEIWQTKSKGYNHFA